MKSVWIYIISDTIHYPKEEEKEVTKALKPNISDKMFTKKNKSNN